MKKIRILFFATCIAILMPVNAEKPSAPPPPSSDRNDSPRLRTFSIHALKVLSEMAKSYELQQKVLQQLDKENTRREYEKIIKEELKRKSIFEKYLGSRHYSTSFLRDFHSNRYF